MIEIRIHPQSFDIDYEMKRIQESSSSGAMVSFLGSVRDIQSKNSLKNLEIEHYPKMAHKVLNETAKYAFENWKLSRCLIIHRYGKLKINDPIVLIVTQSDHRKEAFKANEYIIDFLKINAPFWKKENTSNDSYWVSQKP
jgi:molybdopterin synthase catalytic subunit